MVVSPAAPASASRRSARRRGRADRLRRRAAGHASPRRSPSSAARASPRSCWRAARPSPAPSSTPARSTSCGCSSRRSCSAAPAPGRWPQGEGAALIADATPRPRDGRGALGRGPAGPCPAAGVVRDVHGHRSRDRHRRGASAKRARRAPAGQGRPRRGARRGRLGVGQRRLPDRGLRLGRRLRGRGHEPDAVGDHPRRARARRLASTSSRRCERGTPWAVTSSRDTSTAPARSGRCARTASRGGCGWRRRRGLWPLHRRARLGDGRRRQPHGRRPGRRRLRGLADPRDPGADHARSAGRGRPGQPRGGRDRALCGAAHARLCDEERS